MPRSGVIRFVGKLEVLDELEQQLTTSERVAISTLTGMGGIGKTELALQYALKDIKKTPEDRRYQGGICWLNAQGNIGTQLLMFIKECLQINITDEGTLEERIAIAWQRWPRKESLIIFDDVQELTKIEPFLPPNHENHIKVIITTRKQKIAKNFSPLPVELLSLLDSLELLSSFVGKNEVNQDEITAKELCEWLGRLPLGIELVGRYIRETDEELITVFENLKALKLADESLDYPTDEVMTAKRGVAAAFELSWKQLSESAQILAISLSLFSIAPIPAEILLSDEKNLNQIKKDLRDLKNLSLIKDIGNKNYELHPLIWQYFRAELDKFTESEHLKREHCKLMAFIAQKMPATPTKIEIKNFSSVVPHLELIVEEFHPYLQDNDLIFPYNVLGRFYEAQGLYERAEPYFKNCLEITKNRFGEKSYWVLLSFNNLATLYMSQGRYKEAEVILTKDLALQNVEEMEEKFTGHLISIVSNNISELYKKQGRYEEAKIFSLKALDLTKKYLGEEHPDTVIRLNNLAEIYRCQGEYTEAVSIELKTLNLGKKLLSSKHPFIAVILNNIANTYISQGKYEEAEDYYIESCELDKELFGEDSLNITTDFNNLANLYKIQGRYTESEKLYIQSLNISKKFLGEEHPDIGVTLNNLGLLYKNQERYEESEDYYLQSLDIAKKTYGEEHPQIAISFENLASLYEIQGKIEEAKTLLLKTLKMKKKLLGIEHSSVATSLNSLAVLYDNQEEYETAESYYCKALEIMQKIFGSEHPDIAQILDNLALLHDKQGQYIGAEPLHQQALGMKKKLLGESSPNVALSLNNFATSYHFQKKYSLAIPYFEEAIQIFRKTFGNNDSRTKKVIKNYLLMLEEAPEKEIFPLIAPEWKAQILNMKTSFKTSRSIPKERKSKVKKKITKRGKGFLT